MANLTRYTEEEKERALTVAAIHRGNVSKAVRELERAGQPIPRATLRGWIDQEPQRYQSIIDHRARVVEADITEEIRDQLRETLMARRLSLNATVDQLDKGEAKDPSAVDRNLMVSAGILTTKLLEVTDRKPTQRVEIDDLRSAEQVLAHSGLVVEQNPDQLDDGSSSSSAA